MALVVVHAPIEPKKTWHNPITDCIGMPGGFGIVRGLLRSEAASDL